MADSPTDPAQLQPADIEEAISEELTKVHEDAYGIGAKAVKTHFIGDVVLTVLDIELTTAEQTLVDAGRGEAVRKMRQTFQETIEPTFRAIVEHATGRTVTAFLSDLHIDPLFSTEIFRLAPR
jgi:uncharacterized protein YbcI